MKKARLKFSPIELAYQRKYNIMPDYHFDELCRQYGADIAGKTISENMAVVWREYKQAASDRERSELAALMRECPF